jgi:hypothetical protein
MNVRGIIMTSCTAISHASLFENGDNNEQSSISTPTRGGDAFDKELARDCRFISSGLNLTFERLLLGASLRL